MHAEPTHTLMDKYKKYNLKRRDTRRADRLRIRTWLNAKKDIPCADCKTRYPSVCMDFDHRPGEIKCFGIGKNANGMALSTLEDEISKCDVVCANCHRIRTCDRR